MLNIVNVDLRNSVYLLLHVVTLCFTYANEYDDDPHTCLWIIIIICEAQCHNMQI